MHPEKFDALAHDTALRERLTNITVVYYFFNSNVKAGKYNYTAYETLNSRLAATSATSSGSLGRFSFRFWPIGLLQAATHPGFALFRAVETIPLTVLFILGRSAKTRLD